VTWRIGRTDLAGHGYPLTSASEWMAVPVVGGSDDLEHDGRRAGRF
jgi:hypothetical protein